MTAMTTDRDDTRCPASALSAPRSAEQPSGDHGHPSLVERLSAAIARHVFTGGLNGPEDAARRVLAEPVIADALAALPLITQLRAEHTPRRWSDESDASTCSCGSGACRTAETLSRLT